MVHRVPRTQEEKAVLESEGMDDPFVESQDDPMVTKAIDSCLWEIVQLQSHYHPSGSRAMSGLFRVIGADFALSRCFHDRKNHILTIHQSSVQHGRFSGS